MKSSRSGRLEWLLALALVAPAASAGTPLPKGSGKRLFLANCASCHGEKGDGQGPAAKALKTPPRNFIAGNWLAGTSENDLVETMTTGLVASGMPSFQALPEPERKAIAAYIKSLKKK